MPPTDFQTQDTSIEPMMFLLNRLAIVLAVFGGILGNVRREVWLMSG